MSDFVTKKGETAVSELSSNFEKIYKKISCSGTGSYLCTIQHSEKEGLAHIRKLKILKKKKTENN